MVRQLLWAVCVLAAAAPAMARPLFEDDFENGIGDWLVYPEVGELATQTNMARDGAALEATYRLSETNLAAGIALPTNRVLTGGETFKVSLRSDHDAILGVGFSEEGDDSRYGAIINVEADRWYDVAVSVERMRLSDDTEDENGQLDLDQIAAIGVIDVSSFLYPQLKDGRELKLWIDDLSIDTEPSLTAYSSTRELPYLLENFETDLLSWLPMRGTLKIEDGALAWTYDEQGPSLAVVAGQLGPLPATGASHVLLTLRSARPAQLGIVLQEERRAGQDESRYYKVIDVPGDEAFTTLAIGLDELTLDTNDGAGDENNKLDLDQVAQLIVGDVDLLFGNPRGENTLWIDEIELIGVQ